MSFPMFFYSPFGSCRKFLVKHSHKKALNGRMSRNPLSRVSRPLWYSYACEGFLSIPCFPRLANPAAFQRSPIIQNAARSGKLKCRVPHVGEDHAGRPVKPTGRIVRPTGLCLFGIWFVNPIASFPATASVFDPIFPNVQNQMRGGREPFIDQLADRILHEYGLVQLFGGNVCG